MASPENLNPKLFQGQLFPVGSTRTQDPGEQSFDQWLEHPTTAYHGSFREDWDSAPYAHYGDVKAASQRLRHVGNLIQDSPTHREGYYSGEEPSEEGWYGDEAPEPQTHTGRVFARRLDLGGDRNEFSDMAANTAHYHQLRKEGYEHWETPASIRESTDYRAKENWEYGREDREPSLPSGGSEEAARLLERGKAISYRNAMESGDTAESFVAPRSAASSWEGDVLTSKHSTPLARQVAKQRISEGKRGAVPFPSDVKTRVEQLTFPSMGKGVGRRMLRGGFGVSQESPRTLNQIQFTTLDE